MPPGAGSDDELPPLDVEVPDDARELDADLEALRRERRTEARRARASRVFRTRRYQQFGVSGPAVVVALLVVGIIATVFAVLGPTRSGRLGPEPLATEDPDLVAPATLVTSRGRRVVVSDLRPAVVALLPPNCDCASALRDVADQARSYGLGVAVVIEEAEDRPPSVPPFTITLEQVEGDLFAAYDARGLTLLLLAADGTVQQVLTDVEAGERLSSDLQPLVA